MKLPLILASVTLITSLGCYGPRISSESTRNIEPEGEPLPGQFHCRCAEHVQSTEDHTKAWVKHEIPIGMTREEAIIILKKHGLERIDSRFVGVRFQIITNGCMDHLGPDILLGVSLNFDQSDRVKQTIVTVDPPDGTF